MTTYVRHHNDKFDLVAALVVDIVFFTDSSHTHLVSMKYRLATLQ